MLRVAASGGKLGWRVFTFSRCALGRLREPLREFFLALLCYRGGCKWSGTETVRIYVPTCCCGIGKRVALLTHTWMLAVRYLRLLTCTCVLALMLALANLHLDTLGYLRLLTHTWIQPLGYLQLDTC